MPLVTSGQSSSCKRSDRSAVPTEGDGRSRSARGGEEHDQKEAREEHVRPTERTGLFDACAGPLLRTQIFRYSLLPVSMIGTMTSALLLLLVGLSPLTRKFPSLVPLHAEAAAWVRVTW
jgi:hypothetical protein